MDSNIKLIIKTFLTTSTILVTTFVLLDQYTGCFDETKINSIEETKTIVNNETDTVLNDSTIIVKEASIKDTISKETLIKDTITKTIAKEIPARDTTIIKSVENRSFKIILSVKDTILSDTSSLIKSFYER